MKRAWPALVLCAATLLAYGGSLRNGFVWDDGPLIVRNQQLRDLSQLPQILRSFDEFPGYWRPLSRASYALDYRLFGLDAAGYHAVNVALHLCCALLLYLLALHLLQRKGPALFAALLLAVHPACSEPVLFLSGRNNLLALLFVLAALLLLVRDRPLLSAAAFFLGLCSKEPALFAAPLFFAILPRPRRLRALVPHAVALAVYAAARLAAVGAPPFAGGSLFAHGLSLLPGYFALAVFPRDLTIFHPDTPAPLLAFVAIAAAVAALIRFRTPATLFGLCWLAAELLPLANVGAISSAHFAERYFYAPSVGLWLIAADLAARRWARMTAAFAAMVLVPFAVRTAVRVPDWRDDATLLASAIRVDPRSVPAHRSLAVVRKDAGDLAGARIEWEAALAADPRDVDSLVQLATLAAVQGDAATAEARYREVLSIADVPLAHYNLALICERSGRAAEAIEQYRAFVDSAQPAYGGRALVPFALQRIAALQGR